MLGKKSMDWKSAIRLHEVSLEHCVTLDLVMFANPGEITKTRALETLKNTPSFLEIDFYFSESEQL
jgi:hypothetical protein